MDNDNVTEIQGASQSEDVIQGCENNTDTSGAAENVINAPKVVCQNDDLMQQVVTMMFEKKFKYQPNASGEAEWVLPPATELFKEYYQLDELQQLKQRLNEVKSKLNDFPIEEWNAHTYRKDPANEIPWRLKQQTNAELVTIAWCKFFECLHNYPLVKGPKLNSLHLCEAPGAFIAALNHYLYSKYNKDEVDWNWLSTTLNPYYEGNPLNQMINDDRLILQTLNQWLFHEDFTGNLIDRKNIENIASQCATRLHNDVHLITADGSVACIETPAEQEAHVATLHYAEIVTALSILSCGGCFVIKLFTQFEAITVSKMYLLNCVFEEVIVYKPTTSKRGNSEVYVVCLGYKKNTKNLPDILALMKKKLTDGSDILPIFGKAHFPRDFLLQHDICSRMFMNLQIEAIQTNITTFNIKMRYQNEYNRQMRSLVADEFYKRYNVQPIPEDLTIFRQCHDKLVPITNTFIYTGSYSERILIKAYTTDELIFRLRSQLNELDRKFGSSDLQWVENTKSWEKLPQKVYTGEPYPVLYNSLFVTVKVVILRTKLQDIYGIDPIWYGAPKCVFDGKYEIMLDCKETSNFCKIQHKFFLTVLSEILSRKPVRVVFKDYPFLTHFSVSMLRFLAVNIFNHISICTNPNLQISLHMDGEKYLTSTMYTINSLHNILQSKLGIMSILDILELHRNNYYRALTHYNNCLMVKKFKLMLELDH